MYEWIQFFHLAAAVIWLGGMALVLLALRPAAIRSLEPAQRLPLMAAVLARFFTMVWISIAVLLGSGLWMMLSADLRLAPRGWHVMSGLGTLMCLIFAHLWLVPYRRLKTAIAAGDLPAAGVALGQIHPLVVTNFALGWLAVAAVQLWR
ncbi:MAG: DUF4149 domain-containing protein [Limnohabitans sp.]